jgi:enterochelin esterase-like enzyme
MPASTEHNEGEAERRETKPVAAAPDGAAGVTCEDFCDDLTLPPGGTDLSPAAPSGQGYMASQGRDLRIDLLRGYFVLAMVIDHVRGMSPLYFLTGGNRFYTSAAEGFIFTSGLVAGLVYGRLIKRDGMASALMKLLNRALTLYLLTVGVTLLLLPLSEALYLPWAEGVNLSDPPAIIVSIFTLHRTYYLIDVMLLYTVLFIVVPLAFILMERGKTWTLLVISWLIWALYQVFPQFASFPWDISGNYLFALSAWQALFFTGLILGYHHNRLPTLNHRQGRLALVISGVLMALLLAVFFLIEVPTLVPAAQSAAQTAAAPDFRIWLQNDVFSKVDLRPGRFVASAITFTFMFLFVSVFWAQVRRAVGWLLLPLGQHALYAYTAHIVIAAMVAVALSPLHLASPGPQWLNALIQAGSIACIFVLVRRQFLAPNPRTQRLWNAAPLAVGVVVLFAMYWIPTPAYPGLGGQADAAAAQSGQASPLNRFGTPIPKAAPKPPVAAATPDPALPTLTPTPAPTPTPTPEPRLSANLRQRLGSYVGDIQGSLQELWFYSPALDRNMPYIIYLPPDYGTAQRRYPVLYLLHGRGGHRDEWPAYGAVDSVDAEITSGDIPPMLVVFPQGDTGFWVDSAGGGPRWGAYITSDMVRHIDGTYRTLRESSARAIGGLSMGGWGALVAAFLNPDVFGVVGAHGPSLYTDDGALPFLGTGAAFAARDPVSIARALPADELSMLQIWVDTGVDDPWNLETTALHTILIDKGVDHSWQVYAGGHDYTYWRAHVTDYMHFYGQALALR